MNKISIIFLKISILIITSAALTWMFLFPQTEGRATNLNLIQTYLDPFIIYIYIASIPFFIALFQAFKILSLINNNKFLSKATLKAVKKIKYCAVSIITFIGLAEVYLFIFLRNKSDDIAGGVMMGFFIIFVSLIVLAMSDVFERLLQEKIT